MERKSLEKIRDIVLNALYKSNDVDLIDKMEVIINLYYFLDPNEYKDNIKTLIKKRKLK